METSHSEKLVELDSLIEFSRLVNSSYDLRFILGNILFTIMGKMMITKGLIFLKNEKADVLRLEIAKGIKDGSDGDTIPNRFPVDANFTLSDFDNAPDIFIKNKINFFFKIYFDRRLLGVLCLGDKFVNSDNSLSKRDVIFIESLLSISASAIENSIRFNEITNLNSNLSTKIRQLNSLFELSKEYNSVLLESSKIVRLLGYTLRGSFAVKDFFILNFSSDKIEFLSESKIDLTDDEIRFLSEIKHNYKTDEVKLEKLQEKLSSKEIILLVPIFNHGKLSNIVFLSEKLNKLDFTNEDLNFLESVLNLSAISIDNSVLVKQYLEKQKIEKELNIAREIQLGLLPDVLPEMSGYDLHALNIPARFVGGDYYDVIKLNESECAFIIADVSGKGMPASLLMANIQSAVHSFLSIYSDSNLELTEVTAKLNSIIYDNTASDKFITFFWGILNKEKHTFKYINAGHNPPFHISGDNISELKEGGLMIGVMKDMIPYESGEINIGVNDIIVLFTDGVSEAKNVNDDEFSEESILNVIKENKNSGSKEITEKLIEEINNFSRGTAQFDDITTIVIKRTD